MMGTNHEAAHYAFFSSLLSLLPSYVQIPSSKPCSRNPATYILFPQSEKPSSAPIHNNRHKYTAILSHTEQKYKWFYTKWHQTLLRCNLPWNFTIMQFWCVCVAPIVWTLTHFQMIHLLSFAVIVYHIWTCTQFCVAFCSVNIHSAFLVITSDPAGQPCYLTTKHCISHPNKGHTSVYTWHSTHPSSSEWLLT